MLPPSDMARQAETYRRAGATAGAPPVRRVLHSCEDEAAIGVPFFVMEPFRGESFDRRSLPAWLDASTARDRLSRHWVGTRSWGSCGAQWERPRRLRKTLHRRALCPASNTLRVKPSPIP